jgi:hypothetical protein
MAAHKYKSAWMVERRDHDSGYISYEVWSQRPFTRLFCISEHDNKAAKAIAENIVAQHNEAADMLDALYACASLLHDKPEHHAALEKARVAIAKAEARA